LLLHYYLEKKLYKMISKAAAFHYEPTVVYTGKYITPTSEDNKSRIKDNAVNFPVYSDSTLLSFKNRRSARR
jgi:hypothetical protein